MLKEYDPEMLQEINDSVDLLQYVGQSIEMKKKGKDYFGRCPLHVDKTPSFSITPDVNRYYCFSCRKSGGIIGFLMDYEGLRFDAAVEKAAQLAEIDLSKMCTSQTMVFLKNVKKAMSPEEGSFQHEVLDEFELDKYRQESVQEWIDEGITQETMDVFGVRVDDRGNRIVYPVYDTDGNLINVKGRTRFADYKRLHIPKYINYHSVGKLDYLQGLNVTLPYVEDKKEIIIFESIKSVMKAWQWGYKNCVSAETHGLSDEQVKLLVKLKVNVVFAWDSDVNYWAPENKKSIDVLKRITNVHIVEDQFHLLGGAEAKNAPVDLGEDIWRDLYKNRRKVV